MFQNLKKLFFSKSQTFAYIFLVALSGILWWAYTDIAIMFGNYGFIHTYTDIFLSVIMILGFPLFILVLFYRGLKFGKHENLNKKTGLGLVGGTIGTIISGCSCCGLTLAAYFGFLPLMNFLPYDGLELKIVATLGLLYALYALISELDTCKIKK